MKMDKEKAEEIRHLVTKTGNEPYFKALLEDNRISSIKSNIALGISVVSLIVSIVIGILTLLK